MSSDPGAARPPAPRRPGDDAPAVSVVVPTVDREQLLARAVASVARQDYPGPVEIVVVRDGGPRPQAAQAELEQALTAHSMLAGVRLRWVANTRSTGLPGARNSGILAASGELVAFCDDDDEWLPGKLAAQVPLLLREPGASLVATGIEVVTRTVGTGRDGETLSRRLGPLRPTTLADLLAGRIMELHPSSFVLRRADLLGPIGLVDEDLPGGYGEDYDLLLRAAAVGPVLSVPRALTRIHWHGSSYYFSRWQMIHQALDALLAKHPQFDDVPRGKARIRGQQAVALAAMGRRGDAVRTAAEVARLHRGEPRAYVAVMIASGLVSVEKVQTYLHARGRGL